MTHVPDTIGECERLYVDEMFDPKNVSEITGVPPTTFHRWKRMYHWDERREDAMSLREKVGKLLLRLIDQAIEEGTGKGKQLNAQHLHSIINMLKQFQDTGRVREKIIYEEDASVLLETMREIPKLKTVLDDPAIMSELGEKLKAKIKK